MLIGEQISAAFKEDKTLVFPSETSARSQLIAFLKNNPEQAVLTDKSLSWDTYKRLKTSFPKDKKPVDMVQRFIFVYEFFDKTGSGNLRFFNAKEFIPEIVNILPKLKRMLENKDLNVNLLHDIQVLYDAYNSYLDNKKLYEEDYYEPEICEDNTVFVFPESYKDKNAKSLKNKISSDLANLPNIRVFDNSLAEIRDCIRKINSLLEKDVDPNEIAITVTDINTYGPVLQSEAYKRSIKLALMKGKMLSEYAAGQMFIAIKKIYEEDYTIASIKEFLLNPAYPFKDKELISETIRLAVLCNVEIAGKDCFYLKGRLKKCPESSSPKVLDFVIKFCEYIKGICTAKTAEVLRKSIKAFQDYYFEQGSWDSSNNELERSVFQRCFETIEAIEIEETSIQDVYSLFCAAINNISYVPQNIEGIKVYEYPLSCGLSVKHHFVLGLDDASSKVYIDKNPFEGKLSNEQENQIGDSLISSYCSDSNITISCALESFTDTCIVPSVFSENKKVDHIKDIIIDAFVSEEQLWDGKEVSVQSSVKQQESFNRALKTIFSQKEGINIPSEDKPYKVSATRLQEFNHCPFRYMCKYLLNLEQINFDPQTHEYLELGNILHATYEQWFETVKTFDNAKTEDSKKLLRKIFEKNFKNYSNNYNVPSPIYMERIEQSYSDKLFQITKNHKNQILEGCTFFDKEQRFNIKFDRFSLNGAIDLLFKDSEGNFVVIDLKTGSVDNFSQQIGLYAKVLKTPVKGAYYSIGNKTFKVVFSNEVELAQVIDNCDQLIASFVSTLDSNKFESTPGEKNCESCSFDRICRKRYVVK